MAPGPDERLLIDDPALASGEWLFRRRGEVFGPVESRAIAAMLYRGEIDAATPVSSGDGAWRPVGELPMFLLHAKKAAAALRVEREVTGARLLRQRRSRRRAIALGVVAVLLVAGGLWAGFFFAPRSAPTSGLTEDFGGGISVASRAQVGVSRRAVAPEDEIEVALDGVGTPGSAPAHRDAARPAPRRTGEVDDGGGMIAQHFDAGRIEAVVAREQRTLASCFREEAGRSPDFEGNVPIEFTIGNEGRVVALWIDEPRFRDGALKDCLLRALGTWRFDAFPGQRPTVQLAFRIGK